MIKQNGFNDSQVASDAIRKKKNICVFSKKRPYFLCEKNLASEKTLKKCFFFKYSFKRNYKLTVASINR